METNNSNKGARMTISVKMHNLSHAMDLVCLDRMRAVRGAVTAEHLGDHAVSIKIHPGFASEVTRILECDYRVANFSVA